MNLNASDKELLISALDTEAARLKRAANTSPNAAIKEILGNQLASLHALSGRFHNEPVVKEGK